MAMVKGVNINRENRGREVQGFEPRAGLEAVLGTSRHHMTEPECAASKENRI